MTSNSDLASFEDFLRLDLRAGRVISAVLHEGARHAAYRLVIDFGPGIGTRQSSARLTALYAPADLIGRTVLAAVNLAPKLVAGFRSEVLVLGLPAAGGAVVLIEPERAVDPGARVF